MHFLMWVKISFDLYGSNWGKLNALTNVKFIYVYIYIYIHTHIYVHTKLYVHILHIGGL